MLTPTLRESTLLRPETLRAAPVLLGACPWTSWDFFFFPEEGRWSKAPYVPDKSLDRGVTFNRSQRVSCSATYETLTQNQVVYE